MSATESRAGTGGLLVVLQSFPEPRPTTNPYLVLLRSALESLPDVAVLTFTWRRALTARYTVFHVHWPEILLSGRDAGRTAARRAAFLLLLLRLTVTRTPVVRTAHNVRPHAGVSRTDAVLLHLLDRLTTVVVTLNEQTPVPAGIPSVTVPHGHYREWFAPQPRSVPRPSHAAFVGLIRPYKNVEGLVSAFRSALDRAPGATLRIAGEPSSPELAEALRAATRGVAPVTLDLDHLTDEELVRAVTSAELVVLPYREMHNSGAALLALSLDRPVLVPENEVTDRLAEEVGPGWVLRYCGELTGDRLVAAFREARRLSPGDRPDLGRREWGRAGAEHVAAYRLALRLVRERRHER